MKKKRIDVFNLIILIAGMLFYVFISGTWVSIEDDSAFYMYAVRQQGVMPLYPSLIHLARLLVNNENYLSFVVIFQSILAAYSTWKLVVYLKSKFQLARISEIFLYLFCALPFSIYLPESGITHQIMTEGIAYSLFYLFFLEIMKYVYNEKRYPVGAFIFAFLLGITRSQLVIVYVFLLLVMIYKNYQGKKEMKQKILSFLKTGVIGIILVLLCLVVQGKVYQYYYTAPSLEAIRQVEKAKEDGVEESEEKQQINQPKLSFSTSVSQVDTLILVRGFYEVDESDVELFSDPEMKNIFLRAYKAVDEAKYRYTYARNDLYMWKDLIKDKIGNVVIGAIRDYYTEQGVDVSIDLKKICNELGYKVLFNHFGRYLYHTVRMFIPGFISSVFFQIEKIYLACHIYTLCIFLYAFWLLWYSLRKGLKREAELLGVTVLFIVLLVGITNLVFFGLQRYMVYLMGIFYCSVYICSLSWIKETNIYKGIINESSKVTWLKKIICSEK